MSPAPGRLRRALLPTWPPQNVPEAMLLVVCVAALRLLLELWFVPDSPLAADAALDHAALVVAGTLLRLLALALLLALAVLLALRCAAATAIGLAGLLLAATWPAPLLAPWLPLPGLAALSGALACGGALLAGRRQGAMPARTAAAAVAAGLLVAAAPFYDAGHAWLLDAAGVSVRGALVGGLDGARRGALDAFPALAATALAWLVLGGAAGRCLPRLARRAWGWPLPCLCAVALAWGFVDMGRRAGLLPGLLQPPAVYGPAMLLLAALALGLAAAGLRARRGGAAERLGRSEIAALLCVAAVLAFVAGDRALPALASVALPLLVLAWLPAAAGRARLAPLVLAAALGATLWLAGAAAVPGLGDGTPAPAALTLAGMACAGAAAAGLGGLTGGGAVATRPRGMAALWLLDYGLGLCAVAFGTGSAGLPLVTALGGGALLLGIVVARPGREGWVMPALAGGTAGLALAATWMLAPGAV